MTRILSVSFRADVPATNSLPLPNPQTDGLMPFALNLYKNLEPRLADMWEAIKSPLQEGRIQLPRI